MKLFPRFTIKQSWPSGKNPLWSVYKKNICVAYIVQLDGYVSCYLSDNDERIYCEYQYAEFANFSNNDSERDAHFVACLRMLKRRICPLFVLEMA